MDIFDSDIDFIFEDGATKTKLKHNAPNLLRALLIDNIKSRCASVYTEKEQGLKVDKLFGDMTMSYLLKDRSRPDIVISPNNLFTFKPCSFSVYTLAHLLLILSMRSVRSRFGALCFNFVLVAPSSKMKSKSVRDEYI